MIYDGYNKRTAEPRFHFKFSLKGENIVRIVIFRILTFTYRKLFSVFVIVNLRELLDTYSYNIK